MQVHTIKTLVESPYGWFQRLNLEYHKLLSHFAFKFDLRGSTSWVMSSFWGTLRRWKRR